MAVDEIGNRVEAFDGEPGESVGNDALGRFGSAGNAVAKNTEDRQKRDNGDFRTPDAAILPLCRH